MAYKDTIADLEQLLFRSGPDAQRIYNLINELKSFVPIDSKEIASNNEPKIIKMVFDRNWPATEQVLFALKYLNRISKASEIISTIKEFDSSFDKGLSTPFYKLKEAGVINTFNPTITEENQVGSNHQVYYGLKEWFVGENKVKNEYLGPFEEI
ncbi:MAG: hypothetical protein AAGC65_18760 [Mucilaginibacter sp.]|uniref:hypothetical protein n=1 Tax=Mucilaginibacter sp. TaxID=1882438 RepID=UPI0031AA815B